MSFIKWLDKNFEYVCLALILAVMTVLSFTNVIMRYVFRNALSWSDEVCCYCLAVSAFFSLAASIRNHSMIRVDTLTSMLGKKVQKVVEMIGYIFMLVFLVFCVTGSAKLVAQTQSTGQTSPALQIPVALLYGIMEFCFVISLIRTVQQIVLLLMGKKEEDK